MEHPQQQQRHCVVRFFCVFLFITPVVIYTARYANGESRLQTIDM